MNTTKETKNATTATAKRIKVYLALAGLKGQAIKAGGVKAGRYILKAGENEVASIIVAFAREATARGDWKTVKACKGCAQMFAPAGGFLRRSAAIVAAAEYAKINNTHYLAEGLAKELPEAEKVEAAYRKQAQARAEERARAREAYKATPEYKAAQAAKAKATAEAKAAKVIERAQARAAEIIAKAQAA